MAGFNIGVSEKMRLGQNHSAIKDWYNILKIVYTIFMYIVGFSTEFIVLSQSRF